MSLKIRQPSTDTQITHDTEPKNKQALTLPDLKHPMAPAHPISLRLLSDPHPPEALVPGRSLWTSGTLLRHGRKNLPNRILKLKITKN